MTESIKEQEVIVLNKNDKNELYDKCIYNLKILSELKNGDKMYIEKDNLVIDNRFLLSFSRFFGGDNRILICNYIDKLLKDVQNLIKNIKSDKEKSKYLFCDLCKATTGINALKQTYSDDQSTISKLNIFIRNIESIITNYF